MSAHSGRRIEPPGDSHSGRAIREGPPDLKPGNGASYGVAGRVQAPRKLQRGVPSHRRWRRGSRRAASGGAYFRADTGCLSVADDGRRMSVIPCQQNRDLRKLIEEYAEVLKTESHKLGAQPSAASVVPRGR